MGSAPQTRDVPVLQADGRNSPMVEEYLSIRHTSLKLCAPLSSEDHGLQSMPDASPAKWHLAHTTWFFETFILAQQLPDYRPFNDAFRNLFNSYYNAIGDRPQRALRHILSRPSLDEIHAYRDWVDEAMVHILTADVEPPVLALIELGVNHEQQHQELIVTDVKHGLWMNPLRPAYHAGAGEHESGTSGALLPPQWRSFSAGLRQIGYESNGFAFDNESPRHTVYVEAFRLASRLVTNGEYLEFVRDGGYRRPELWLADGWDCLQNNRWSAPLYWEDREGQWCTYTMAGMQPLNLAEPVCHVSSYEADAFARWSGGRLPTEFEWEIAAASLPMAGNLLESGLLHPQPAPAGQPLAQIFGDVWEWTASPYVGYPGFKPAAGAVGEYNGKFMCNQFVLRGGSCATPQSHIRATYRNFFPPPARWQFTGIRLANGS